MYSSTFISTCHLVDFVRPVINVKHIETECICLNLIWALICVSRICMLSCTWVNTSFWELMIRWKGCFAQGTKLFFATQWWKTLRHLSVFSEMDRKFLNEESSKRTILDETLQWRKCWCVPLNVPRLIYRTKLSWTSSCTIIASFN